jgi:hypothetical protein
MNGGNWWPGACGGIRRLVRDYERTLTVLAGLPLVALACLELARALPALWVW